jgi:peptide/nickel transport system permease protein
MKLLALVRRQPTTIFSLFVVATLLVLAILGSRAAPYDPLAVDLPHKLQAPSAAHPFGTDDMGRDVLSRVIVGTRLSVQTIVVIMTISVALGLLVGTIAGYFGSYMDEGLMRVTDIFLAFPALILALAIVAALGPSLLNAMLAISLVWWPWYARMVRGQVLSVKENQYVEAARSIGARHGRIMLRHILPNCMMPVIVQASMDMGAVLVTTAGLSFIGLGAQAPTPEWGAMVGIGRRYLLGAWWISAFPGLAIFITVMGLNLLGDALQDVLWSRTK